MAVTLPRAEQLKLDHTLAQWRHWRCASPLSRAPRVLRKLGSGHSNCSVLVESGGRYVVRIDGISPAAHGLNRQAEWRIMHSAHGAGLAPRPCYFNPDLGSLVCEYLAPDDAEVPSPEAVAHLLRGIHDLPPCHLRLDLRDRIGRYERQLAHRGPQVPAALSRQREPVLDCLARREDARAAPVLCHNDLLSANRLASGGGLWAIDWEYSAMGDPWYDLAVVICGDNLPGAESQRLVAAYLGQQPTALQSRALQEYCAVYRYLELLWHLALERPVIDERGLARALDRLAEAVAAVSP